MDDEREQEAVRALVAPEFLISRIFTPEERAGWPGMWRTQKRTGSAGDSIWLHRVPANFTLPNHFITRGRVSLQYIERDYTPSHFP